MSDLIDRQALLKQIDIDSDGEPGYYGDTWKFIDTIKSMPPTELSTNLAEVGTDCISRQAAIEVIDSFNVFESRCDQIKLEQMIGELPPAQPAKVATDINVGDKDTISRQAAISAICNACGKIDCDKMDKCEKLQLPPANCSEFPNNSDTISRQAAIEALNQQAKSMSEWSERYEEQRRGVLTAVNIVEDLPPAQPEQLEQCPIYGGMCAYPSDQCYDCPRHAGAKMGVTE